MQTLARTLAAGVLLIAGCTPAGVPSASSGPKTLRIGAIFPLSGSVANAGANALNGTQLAVEVLNGKHPEIDLPKLTVGTIELVSVDSQGDPQNGAADVDRLVNTEKVVAIQGAYQSSVTLTASQQADRLGIPFVNGAAGAADLSDRGLKWWFRTGPTLRDMAQTYFEWLKEIAADHPVKKIAVIHMNDAAGNDLATQVKEASTGTGIDLIDDISFQSNATDLTGQVQKLRADAPDAVFAIMFINDTVLFLRTMAQLGYTPPALLAGGGGWDDPDFLKQAGALGTNNVRAVTWGTQVTDKNPVAKAADDVFLKSYGRHLNGDSARTFTATLTLGQALEAANSTDPEKIRAALLATNITKTIMPWQGIKFDQRGQNTLAGYLVLQAVQEDWQVLHPKELQTASPVWPLPQFTVR